MSFAEVSVIIPACQASRTIARALEGIAAQTLMPREVIVVDDGSDDATYKAALECKPHMNGIDLHVFRQGNQGAGAARNRAILESTQPLLAFLDADDEWLPEKLARSLEHMAKDDYLLVAHNGWMVEDGEKSLIDGARRFKEGPSPFVSLYRKGFLDTCTVVARRDAVIKAGGFDEELRNGQDFELWLALLKDPNTKFLVFDGPPLTRYHVTPDSIMSHTARRLACCLKIAKRYGPDLKNHPGSPIVSVMFRILAVHYEAIQIYLQRKQPLAILITLLKMPFHMIHIGVYFIFASSSQRKNYLEK